jgi:hypothetical protein
VNRLRVFMMDHPSRLQIHLNHLSQEPGPPLFDVIDVACSYCPTFNRTLSAPRFFGEPVPPDRLPSW